MGPVALARGVVLDHVELRHDRRVVLSDVCGTFPSGSLTAVIGANGSGKTTLLRALAGLHPPSTGRIERGGLRPALLPQGSQLDRSFPLTCLDVVALATPGLGWFRQVSSSQRQVAAAALNRVGLTGLEAQSIQVLSAGQFQRLLFARTVVQDAPIILLDEPFTAVDAATAKLFLTIVQEWHAQGRTQVVVLHDMELVRRHFPRTLLLTGDSGFVWNVTSIPRQAA